MNQKPWLNHPALKTMHPVKLQVINELAENASGKPLIQTAPYLLKAQRTLKEAGLSFTPEESTLLMEILAKDMTPAEKQQVERLKSFLQQQKK